LTPESQNQFRRRFKSLVGQPFRLTRLPSKWSTRFFQFALAAHLSENKIGAWVKKIDPGFFCLLV
jgi:hypothetical protein